MGKGYYKSRLVPLVILMDGSICNIDTSTNQIKTVCDFEDLVKQSIRRGYVTGELIGENQLCRLIPISAVKEFTFTIYRSKCRDLNTAN